MTNPAKIKQQQKDVCSQNSEFATRNLTKDAHKGIPQPALLCFLKPDLENQGKNIGLLMVTTAESKSSSSSLIQEAYVFYLHP